MTADIYYPIDYSVQDGMIRADILVCDCHGDCTEFEATAPMTRAGWLELHRLSRAWLHGWPVICCGVTHQLEPHLQVRGPLTQRVPATAE